MMNEGDKKVNKSCLNAEKTKKVSKQNELHDAKCKIKVVEPKKMQKKNMG